MSVLTPLVLGALALALAGPAPARLARASWPGRVPRAALVFWQALALAAVLSALGAGLSAGLLIVTHDRPTPAIVVVHATALVLTLVVAARLLWSAHTFGVGVRARRRRHRDLVDLLARTDARVPGARVLDLTPPVAYCIPGLTSRLVVSTPALDSLAADEIDAVLVHERAHARARHDLVLEGFSVLHNAFPRIVRSRAALDSTAGLIEMLADDAARRRVGPLPLARALATLADAPVPSGALGSGSITPAARIRRLAAGEPGSATALAAGVYAAATAVVVVPTVTVAVPWMTVVVALL